MVDAMRAMLDELMGKERNVPLAERTNRRIRFTDEDVCKYDLVAMCPNQLFKNTRSDLGAPLLSCKSWLPSSTSLLVAVNYLLLLVTGNTFAALATGPCGFEIHQDHLEWASLKDEWDKLDERGKDRCVRHASSP